LRPSLLQQHWTWHAPVPTADAQTEPSPTITVTPDTDLVDGQVVEVTGAGFTPQSSVWLSQCPTGITLLADVIQACGQTPVMVLPDASGGFSVSTEVTRQIPAGDCARAPGTCSMVVVDIGVMSVVAQAPIDVTDAPTMSENISVRPSAVDDGDTVMVTGENFPPDVAVAVVQCFSDRPVTAEWCAAAPVTATTDAAGGFTVELTIERGVTLGSGLLVDCANGCVVAAFTADRGNVATADIEIPEPFLHVQPDQSLTVTPRGTVHIAGQLFCTPAGGGNVDIDGTITQVVEDRTSSAPFRASATCDNLVDSWEADVIGHRTRRFKVGPASLTVRANETVDPYPDDDALRTVDVDLVRPDR
jgi:Neocarzinostatin family